MADDASPRAVTHYLGSKGAMEIAAMPRTYAGNALSKLEREHPERTGEIAALRAHIAALDEAYAESQATGGTDEGPPPAGHNGPPADPFTAVKVHCDDLYMEAKHWLDGAEIGSDAEAEAVEKLLDEARKAFQAADAARVEENRPFDEGKAAVQEKYAPLIADTKKVKGTMVRLQEACKAALTPWRQKKQAEAFAAAEAKRKAAEVAAAEAAKAAREAAGNLEATEEAESLIKAAEEAQRDANRAAKASTTRTGLTTYYEAVMTEQRAAILHYMKDQPREFVALAQRLADVDVRNGKRSIPGFTVEERKVAR